MSDVPRFSRSRFPFPVSRSLFFFLLLLHDFNFVEQPALIWALPL